MRNATSWATAAVWVVTCAGLATGAGATGFTDWQYDIVGIGSDSNFASGIGGQGGITVIRTFPSTTQSMGGTGYISARSNFEIQTSDDVSPPATNEPYQQNRLELGLTNYTVQPGDSSFAATGAQIDQSFTGSHSLGASEALAVVQSQVDLTITFDSGPAYNSIISGLFGLNFSYGSTFDFVRIQIDRDGTVSVPAGFTAVQTSPGVWEIVGTYTSPSFLAPTDGSETSWFTTTFAEIDISGSPLGSNELVDTLVTVDSSGTVVSDIVSLDPDASFNLPIPEPSTVVLLALGLLSIAAWPRGRA